MSYYVYILTNKSNTLYVGVTNDLARRIQEHSLKTLSSFTAKYNINKLIYREGFNRVYNAITAEKKIKGWTRKKKLELVKSINPEFKEIKTI